ncbi:MAG: hypothetical protein IJQ45_09260, partial [Clostridia bacterium]|nr:hypothetical protein [Clostridia bacterium]
PGLYRPQPLQVPQQTAQIEKSSVTPQTKEYLGKGELCPFPRQCAAKPFFLQIPSMKKRMLKTEISF